MERNREMLRRQDGFTMAEVLVALLVSAIVLGAIFTAFSSQHKSYLVQDDTAEMQQSLRATMEFVVREIQMAGFDPEQTGNFGFVGAGSDGRATDDANIYFTADIDMDGLVADDRLEQVAYRLQAGVLQKHDPADPVDPEPWKDLADNIEAIEFFYTLADGATTLNPTAAQLPLVRRVQFTLLARSPQADPAFTDTEAYARPSGLAWGPYNDNWRRRLLTRTVLCRNMGLPAEI
jgi:type IV pilus assembly protein PilW